MSKKLLFILSIFFVFIEKTAAHCPLCTAGAGAAAGIAATLGVGLEIIGVFLGAFGIATGLWTIKYVKKYWDRKYFPYQNSALSWIIYLTIVLPVLPMMQDYTSIYISLIGEYGSLLNRTYMLNTYLIGAIIGGLIVYISPNLSQRITKIREEQLPYQGLTMNFSLLIIAAVILHLVV